MKLYLTLEQVHGLIKNEQMEQLLEKLLKYHRLIAEDALASLNNRESAMASWQMFVQGLCQFPSTMPLPNGKTFADYPAVLSEVVIDGFSPFYEWVKGNASDPQIREQVILRNVFHFFEYTLRMSEVIPSDALELLDREFATLDYNAQTYWLSRFFNGLQICLGEMYIVERYLKRLLPPA